MGQWALLRPASRTLQCPPGDGAQLCLPTGAQNPGEDLLGVQIQRS